MPKKKTHKKTHLFDDHFVTLCNVLPCVKKVKILIIKENTEGERLKMGKCKGKIMEWYSWIQKGIGRLKI